MSRDDFAAAKPAEVSDEVLLNSKQVRAQVSGVTNMCLWRWTRDPRIKFPAPDVRINNRKYWYAGTIRRFKARIAAQGAPEPADPGAPSPAPIDATAA